MKRLLAALVILVLIGLQGVVFYTSFSHAAGPVKPKEDITVKTNKDGSATVTLNKETWDACNAGGGCLIAPRASVENTIMSLVKQMCGVTL